MKNIERKWTYNEVDDVPNHVQVIIEMVLTRTKPGHGTTSANVRRAKFRHNTTQLDYYRASYNLRAKQHLSAVRETPALHAPHRKKNNPINSLGIFPLSPLRVHAAQVDPTTIFAACVSKYISANQQLVV